MNILAQTTQPGPRIWLWIYSNVSVTAIMAVIGGLSIVGGALGGKINDAVLWCISTWFGWKTAKQKAQEALKAQADSNTDKIQKVAQSVPNPSASIDEIAKGNK